MGKNKKLRKQIKSLERQIRIHRAKQENIGKGDAPWIKEYWEREIASQTRQVKAIQSQLPQKPKQKHKPLVKKR